MPLKRLGACTNQIKAKRRRRRRRQRQESAAQRTHAVILPHHLLVQVTGLTLVVDQDELICMIERIRSELFGVAAG